VVKISDAGRDGIKRLHCTNQLTGSKDLDLQPPTRERCDRLGNPLGTGLEARQGLGPDGDHLQLADTLRYRRFRQRSRSDTHTCSGYERTAFHFSSPHQSQDRSPIHLLSESEHYLELAPSSSVRILPSSRSSSIGLVSYSSHPALSALSRSVAMACA